MFHIKHYLLLLLLGLSCIGCASQSPSTLHAPIQNIQSRTILLDPQRSVTSLQPLSSADTRPVLKVMPESVAFLSQPGIMLSQNTDGSIGIRTHAPLAFHPGRSEALQAILVSEEHTLLSQAMAPYLFPSCPLPD